MKTTILGDLVLLVTTKLCMFPTCLLLNTLIYVGVWVLGRGGLGGRGCLVGGVELRFNPFTLGVVTKLNPKFKTILN